MGGVWCMVKVRGGCRLVFDVFLVGVSGGCCEVFWFWFYRIVVEGDVG